MIHGVAIDPLRFLKKISTSLSNRKVYKNFVYHPTFLMKNYKH